MANVSAELIEAQLERIMSSPEFVRGPKLCQFLGYVVGQTLNGQLDKLKQYSIAVEGLGYGEGFDPEKDTTVRILARRLRRAIDRYYVQHGAADPIRIEIPKGRYVPVFVDNLSVTAATEESERSSTVAAEPTIAVFELEDLSSHEESGFIARGLTAEILSSLIRFAGLSVLGPFFQKKGQPINYREFGDEYGATFALQGWIRRYGSVIRITTDLIEMPTGRSPWGRTFEFDLDKTSLFAIEDEVVSRVTGVIADGLGVIFRKLNSESHQEHIRLSDATIAILAYNNAWITHAPRDFERANTAVGQALTSHPDDALLIALQSNLYYGDVLHGLGRTPDALSKMEPLALKAISLDPDLQIAQYNLVVQNAFFGRVERCVEAARTVVGMNPNHARILAGCAVATASVGAYELGKELIERAKHLNPQYPGWYFFVDYVGHFRNEQYEQAWVDAQLIHVEGLLWHPIIRGAILGKLGRVGEAKPYVEELRRMEPDFQRRPHDYIRRLFVTDEHVDMIWDGLLKAGMVIDDSGMGSH